MATAPQTTPYHRDRIREGRPLLFIPSGCANWLDLALDQPIGHQCHHREQPKQDWGRSRNRQVIPLALRLNPEMRPSFFKGYFHSPAADEPTQDLQRRMIQIG